MNWNVYKVFKNGKRAKAPLMTFERKGKIQEVTHYFNENIKKNFNEKNRGLKFIQFFPKNYERGHFFL